MSDFHEELKKFIRMHDSKEGALLKLNEIHSAIAESSEESKPNLHYTITHLAKIISKIPDNFL